MVSPSLADLQQTKAICDTKTEAMAPAAKGEIETPASRRFREALEQNRISRVAAEEEATANQVEREARAAGKGPQTARKGFHS